MGIGREVKDHSVMANMCLVPYRPLPHVSDLHEVVCEEVSDEFKMDIEW